MAPRKPREMVDKATAAVTDGVNAVADSVKLPVAKASEIVNEVADQVPLYGLSGAILAVGLVTGRKALARTGARMLTGQVIAALARAAADRVAPAADKVVEQKPAGEVPPEASAPPEPSAARIATGALVGAAAAAAGGWLLSRWLTPKVPDNDAAEDEKS
jgi:hypothetical protein